MSEMIKNGKKPISSKKKPSVEHFSASELFGEDMLARSPELQKELDDQGLVGQFLNATQLLKTGGRHKNGWEVYKRKTGLDVKEIKFGQDPNGYVRVGDLILGVMPKEYHARKRAALDYKAQRLADPNKAAAQNLRQFAKDQGVNITVHEGYEANDTDE
jgi:hypothetical protein